MPRIVNERKILRLKREYFKCIERSNPGNNEECFRNSSWFRIRLYILRQKLFDFIKNTFERYIELKQEELIFLERRYNRRERRPRELALRQKIIEKVRARNATDRRYIIKHLRANQLRLKWNTFASCYTGTFLRRKRVFNVEKESDPKDLLEVITNCSLFKDRLYAAASDVIINRNRYYGHLAHLLISSDTVRKIESSIAVLENEMSKEENIDYNNRSSRNN